MKIAVINETSAADKNADILKALEGRGHTIINAGMTKTGASPELTYIHTGLMSAILINLEIVDFVIGGCGTGQGYLNAVMQYPGMFCGHIMSGLDAWLFTQINGGNCISLVLNQGYGWASDVNLRMIFDSLFSVESGSGYPPHRQESQRASRKSLSEVSYVTHHTMAKIIKTLPRNILAPVLTFPGFSEILNIKSLPDSPLKYEIIQKM